jgi:RNA polymerase sigma factor for flagellar operon FliA
VVDAALAPLSRRLPAAVSRDDLASAGRLALVETLTDFAGPEDEARAYAFTRVRGAMLDELRRLDPLSRRTRARVSTVRRAASELAQEFGRAATVGEVAEATGLSAGDIRRTEQLALAAEAYIAQTDDGADIYARCPDEDGVSPVAFAESGELATLVQAALARLAPNQAYVVRRYHLEDATLEDIAAELGVSKERVRQIRVAGEQKLRSDYHVLALWRSIMNHRQS